MQKKVQAIVDSGQLSIFANAYWGHPAYKLPPEVNLLAVAHYLEALDWQKDVTKIHTIFGGKNPHPNFVVGGVPMPIDLNSDTALNAERLSIISDSIDKMVAFVDQVYLPDLLAIAPYYLEYAGLGEGLGNFLTWGEFPGEDNSDTSKFLVPRAAHPQPGPDEYQRARPARFRQDEGIRRPFLVHLQRRRPGRAASLEGRDRLQLHRPEAAL